MLIALLGFLPDWQSVKSMLTALPAGAKPVVHWHDGKAAFLAGHVAGSGIHSVVRLDEGRTELRYPGPLTKGSPITSLDLDGVQTGATVVLFHTEPHLASSALSFDTAKTEESRLQFILTGLAPGMWEVWRNGWVVEPGVPVRAGEAVLVFEERPGSYFIRRLQ